MQYSQFDATLHKLSTNSLWTQTLVVVEQNYLPQFTVNFHDRTDKMQINPSSFLIENNNSFKIVLLTCIGIENMKSC